MFGVYLESYDHILSYLQIIIYANDKKENTNNDYLGVDDLQNIFSKFEPPYWLDTIYN